MLVRETTIKVAKIHSHYNKSIAFEIYPKEKPTAFGDVPDLIVIKV